LALKRVEDLSPLRQIKRGQILQAAQRLFIERGFERTSMEAIREAAEVSKPTLYTHYQNKEALFGDVVGNVLNQVAGEWIPLVETNTFTLNTPQELQKVLTAFAQQAVTGLMQPEYLALVRLVVAEMPKFPQLGDIFRTAGPERGLRTLALLLEHARSQGTIAIADTEIAARLFIGSLLTYVLLDGLLSSGEPHVPQISRVEAMVALFMQAISTRTEKEQ
jgi:TetR/AcrR family transcriptional regulator, mexJK operon transcriptional repressor